MLFQFSNNNRTATKAEREGYMVIAHLKQPVSSGVHVVGMRLDEYSQATAQSDVDFGVATSTYQWSMDWLRSGQAKAYHAWYISQHPNLDRGKVVIIGISFPEATIRIGVRGEDKLLYRASFDPQEAGPLYVCWACRPAGHVVTLVPAAQWELIAMADPDPST
jgi:hypothetical protein